MAIINANQPSTLADALGLSSAPSSPATGVIDRVVRGAHDTIDRLAESATPQVQRLEAGVNDANGALHAKADQMRGMGEAWTASVRGTVRDKPLSAVAAALVIGALVARIAR
jgi:hypothetical protein